jgi:hypothetical protein
MAQSAALARDAESGRYPIGRLLGEIQASISPPT